MRDFETNELPYSEKVKNMTVEELQNEMIKENANLAQYGVKTAVYDLIDQWVNLFGGEFDSIKDDKSRLSVTGTTLRAAIRHFHPELQHLDAVSEDKLSQATSHLAFAYEEYYSKTKGQGELPSELFVPPVKFNE